MSLRNEGHCGLEVQRINYFMLRIFYFNIPTHLIFQRPNRFYSIMVLLFIKLYTGDHLQLFTGSTDSNDLAKFQGNTPVYSHFINKGPLGTLII